MLGSRDVVQKVLSERPPVEPLRYVDSIWCMYIISVLSAANSEIVTFPLDTVKTRLQIQGEKQLHVKSEVPHHGMIGMGVEIVKNEGFFKLWTGITPMFLRHVIYSGMRMVIYDFLRNQTGARSNNVSAFQSILFSGTAGGLAQWLASPADLVKVQFQMEGRRRLMGLPPRIKGVFSTFQDIYQHGGVKGLWKGSAPNVARGVLVNIGDIATYDVSKHYILRKTKLEDNMLVHFIAGNCAGFASAVMSTPADVIKSRVMNQPVDEHGRGLYYKGPIDCFIKAVKSEGFFALYKGFLPVWLRLGPWSLIFWLSFERLHKLLGGGGF